MKLDIRAIEIEVGRLDVLRSRQISLVQQRGETPSPFVTLFHLLHFCHASVILYVSSMKCIIYELCYVTTMLSLETYFLNH